MEAQCRCGCEVRYPFDHLGCIQCGSACCPACSYELESAHYCQNCAEILLDLPWAAALGPTRMASIA